MYGTINWNGRLLYIKQQPYITNDGYVASAQDNEFNDYKVLWDIVNEDCEDESESCDWSKFMVKKLGL